MKEENHVFMGMKRDTIPLRLEASFLWDAKNVRLTARGEDTQLAITSEKGNTKIIDNLILKGNYIGHCLVGDYLVLFYVLDESGRGAIYRIDKNMNCVTLYEDKENATETLLFSKDYPIEAIASYESEEIQKVYWVDGKNLPRVINVIRDYAYSRDFNFNLISEANKDVSIWRLIEAGKTWLFSESNSVLKYEISEDPGSVLFLEGIYIPINKKYNKELILLDAGGHITFSFKYSSSKLFKSNLNNISVCISRAEPITWSPSSEGDLEEPEGTDNSAFIPDSPPVFPSGENLVVPGGGQLQPNDPENGGPSYAPGNLPEESEPAEGDTEIYDPVPGGNSEDDDTLGDTDILDPTTEDENNLEKPGTEYIDVFTLSITTAPADSIKEESGNIIECSLLKKDGETISEDTQLFLCIRGILKTTDDGNYSIVSTALLSDFKLEIGDYTEGLLSESEYNASHPPVSANHFDFSRKLSFNEDIRVFKLDGGGSFLSGVIQYAFTYFIKNGQESKIFHVTPLLPITHADRGASPEDTVACSFKILLTDLDPSFDYVRIYSIHRTTLLGEAIVSIVADVEIENTYLSKNGGTIVDTGLKNSILDTSILWFIGGQDLVANTIELKDGTLFLGNIKNNTINNTLASVIKGKYEFKLTCYPLPIPSLEGISEYYYYDTSALLSINTMFKSRELYRCGIQVLYDNGEWGAPIFIEDIVLNNRPPATKHPYAQSKILELNEDAVTALINGGAKRVRSCVVYPANNGSRLCLGILCPTVFSYGGRQSGDIYALASWFFRPISVLAPGKYRDQVLMLDTTGSLIEYRHFKALRGLNIYENPTNTWNYRMEYGAEVINSSPFVHVKNLLFLNIRNYAALSLSDITANSDYIDLAKHSYYIDENIVTLHSPDVEFGDLSLFENLNDTHLEIVQVALLGSAYGNMLLKLETASKSPQTLGFINPNIRFPTLTTCWYNGGFSAATAFHCYDSYTSTKTLKYFCLFPWQGVNSVTSDTTTAASAESRALYSKLKTKKLSNMKYFLCNANFLLAKKWNGLSTKTTFPSYNKERTENSGYDSAVIKYQISTPQLHLMSNEKLIKLKPEYCKMTVNYLGNIDTMSTKGFNVWAASTLGGAMSPIQKNGVWLEKTSAVRIKYKSNDHLVFALLRSMTPTDKDESEYYIREGSKSTSDGVDYSKYLYSNRTTMYPRYQIGGATKGNMEILPRALNFLYNKNVVEWDKIKGEPGATSETLMNRNEGEYKGYYPLPSQYGLSTNAESPIVTVPLYGYCPFDVFGRVKTGNPNHAVALAIGERIGWKAGAAVAYSSKSGTTYPLYSTETYFRTDDWYMLKLVNRTVTYYSINKNNFYVISPAEDGGAPAYVFPGTVKGDYKYISEFFGGMYGNLHIYLYIKDSKIIIIRSLGGTDSGKVYTSNSSEDNSKVYINLLSTLYINSKGLEDTKFGYNSSLLVRESPYMYIGEIVKNSNENLFPDDPYSELNVWLPAGLPVKLEKGLSVSIPYRYGDTYYCRYDCVKTLPYSDEDPNLVIEIGSFMVETRINLDGRYDRRRGQLDNSSVTIDNFNNINPVYSLLDNFFSTSSVPEGYSKTTESIIWSTLKFNNSLVDPWCNISTVSGMQTNGDMGKLTSIKVFKDRLLAFLEKGINMINFNVRALIPTSDGVPIEITNNYKVDGYTVLSDSCGCLNKWSIVTTPEGIYFADDYNNSIYRFDGQNNPVSLTEASGFYNWMYLNKVKYPWKPYDTHNRNNLRTFYDSVNRDVYFTWGPESPQRPSLVFSEKLNAFSSFMDYGGTLDMINFNGDFYSVYGNELWKNFTSNNYNEIYGTAVDASISFISNSDPTLCKIFDTIDIRLKDNKFTNIQVENDYQDTGDVTISDDSFYRGRAMLQKNRVWRLLIPRFNKRARIRDVWAKVTLEMKQPEGDKQKDKLQVYDISVNYTI